jgi:protein-S-isoprenylcysteine O-methyltransferase Ste14
MPPVYLVAALVAMTVLHQFLPVMRLVWMPWRWLGLIPLLAGIGLVVWVSRLFHKHHTTIKPGQTSTRLVTDGPFRFSRNPIYVGMVLVLAGAAILFGSLSPWFMLPIFIGTIGHNVIPVEESMLTEAFGSEYQQYQARVRRWI